MNAEMTEILISKFLDSEITPAEQRLLDAKLQQDSRAREMLEQMRQLRDLAQEALNDEMSREGESAEKIFDRAWQESKHPHPRARIWWRHSWRVAAAVAAGFLVGLWVHQLAPLSPSDETSSSVEPQVIVARDGARANETMIAKNDSPVNRKPASIAQEVPKPIIRLLRTPGTGGAGRADKANRTVDWYNYTDKSGTQWFFETYRDDQVTPAAYHNDL